jgi:hypothetical protein
MNDFAPSEIEYDDIYIRRVALELALRWLHDAPAGTDILTVAKDFEAFLRGGA